jgi:hypothetical protein
MPTTHDPAAFTLEPAAVGEADAAKFIGVSPRTFRTFITEGRIKPIRIPGVRRNTFSIKALRALVENGYRAFGQPADEK